jgi:hypothetical protein
MLFISLIKKSVPIIFIIAFVSYVAGVFDLVQSSAVISFTGKASLFVYSFFFAALAIKLNEKFTLPLIFRILSIFLFMLGFVFVYKFAEPENYLVGPLSIKIFYILFALGSAACVSLLFNKNPLMRLLSPTLFIATLGAVFFYQISGNFYYLKDQLETKAFLPKVMEMEENKEPVSAEEFLNNANKDIVITFEEPTEEILYKIHKSANTPPEIVDKILWRCAIREPFEILKDYRKTGEFMLIIIALILYGFLAYIIDVFVYKEEKWTLI